MMGEYQLDDYRLNIIQGSQSDSILLSQALASASTTTEVSKQKLVEQSARIQELEKRLEGYEHYASLGAGLAGC